MRRIATLIPMFLLVITFANHKPHVNLNPDTTGLYDTEFSDMVTFDPPFFADADFSEVEDGSILAKVFHLNSKAEEHGGIMQYVVDNSTAQMQESLDAAMDNYMSAADEAIDEVNECYEE